MSTKPFVIVVGLDYSEHSEDALTRSFELASREAAAELHVISVLPARDLAQPNLPKSVLLDVEVAAVQLQRYVASRWAAFTRSVPEEVRHSPKRVVSHVRFDRPAKGIVQLASDLNADLVVVGSHGRQGLTRLLLGSVSEQVLRLAACPVLVVRPKSAPARDPALEPACERCQAARRQPALELWCEEHRKKQGSLHVYHQHDEAAELAMLASPHASG